MSSHVCPRCGAKGPVLLQKDQLCHNCLSNWAWASFADPRKQITITSDALTAQDAKPLAESNAANAGAGTWTMLVLSLLFSAIVVVLLVYFFSQPPPGISGEKILNRLHNLGLSAGIVALLAVVTSAGVLRFARQKKYDLQTSIRIVGAISILLATGVFLSALFCWAKTERVGSLSSLSAQKTRDNGLVEHLQDATVVVQVHDPLASRYRSSKRAGIIIATETDRMWILTVPYVDVNGQVPSQPEGVWVNFSDGRTLPGRFSQTTKNALAIVEVEGGTPPAQVQLHPTAEGVVPSQSVLVIPNPLRGWKLQLGTILSRAGQRTSSGWSCIVKVNLGLQETDLGSAMYDERGRLLGLMTSFDDSGADSQFVIVDSATISEIEDINRHNRERARVSSL